MTLAYTPDLPPVRERLALIGPFELSQMIAKSLWRHVFLSNDGFPDLQQRGAGNPFGRGSGHSSNAQDDFASDVFAIRPALGSGGIHKAVDCIEVSAVGIAMSRNDFGIRKSGFGLMSRYRSFDTGLIVRFCKVVIDLSLNGHRSIPVCAGTFPPPHVNRYNRLFCTLQRLFCKKVDKMQNKDNRT